MLSSFNTSRIYAWTYWGQEKCLLFEVPKFSQYFINNICNISVPQCFINDKCISNKVFERYDYFQNFCNIEMISMVCGRKCPSSHNTKLRPGYFTYPPFKKSQKFCRQQFQGHFSLYRENSPVTQTTPEPTLLIWGGWPREIISPSPLATLPNLVLSCLSGHSDSIVIEPFDIILWYSSVPRMPNLLKVHRMLKVILEMAFMAHCTQIWKLNQISLTMISKVAWKCIWCCSWVQRCMTAPHWARRWGNIVQWGMKAWSR